MGSQRGGNDWATFTFTETKSKIVEKQWERQKEERKESVHLPVVFSIQIIFENLTQWSEIDFWMIILISLPFDDC